MPWRDPERRRAHAREYQRRLREEKRKAKRLAQGVPEPTDIDVSGQAVQVAPGRWGLACGIHTAARPLTTCPVCDAAHAETVERLDAIMAERKWLLAGVRSVATKIERYGSARHNAPPPKSNAVTLREARKKAAAR